MQCPKLHVWRRKIPRFPVHFKGDPPRYVLLPQFWMKMLYPPRPVPRDTVHFEIHPQMTKGDVKQYLEKIYHAKVALVRTEVRKGLVSEAEKSKGYTHDDQKFAYVQLLNQTFTLPEIDLRSKNELERRKVRKQRAEEKEQKKAAFGVPRWFL